MEIDYSNLADEYTPDVGGFTGASAATIGEAARLATPGKHGTFTTLAGDAALGIVDLADTVASSLPGSQSIFGIQRGQVNAKMLGMVDMPGVSKFYNDNKEGIQVASGIYGIIGAELATRKLLAIAAPAITVLKTVPYARRLATLDDQYAAAMASVRAVDTLIAQRGIAGSKTFTESMLVPVATWGKEGFTTSMQMIGRGKIATKARQLSFGKGVMRAGASELTIAATLNTNEFLFEDAGQAMFNAGLGLLVGGAFDNWATNYAMKKFSNSDVLARFRAEALDPTGLERKALDAAGQNSKSNDYFGTLQGSRMDYVTALMVQAKAAKPFQVDDSTYNLTSLFRQEQAFLELEKGTQKGIFSIPETAFRVEGTEEGLALKHGLDKDETAMLGVEMIGKPLEDGIGVTHSRKEAAVKGQLESLQLRLDENYTQLERAKTPAQKDKLKSIRAGLLAQQKSMKYNDGLTPGVFMDGEHLPYSHGEMWDRWVEPTIKTGGTKDSMLFEAADKVDGTSMGIGIDEGLQIFMPKGKTLAKADHFDVLRLYRAANKGIKALAAKMADDKFQLTLPNNPSWFQLDMAEEVALAAEKAGLEPTIYWGKGLTRESAQVKSFAGKVRELEAKKFATMRDTTEIAKLRVRYNLPRLTAYQMGQLGTQQHPMDILARGAMARGVDELEKLNLLELKEALVKASSLNDLTAMSVADIRHLRGNSFSFMLDEAGNIQKPLLTYRRPLKPHSWTRDDLSTRIAARKFQVHSMLTSEQSGIMTRTLGTAITQSADMQKAGEVNTIADIQLAMNVPGMGNIAPTSASASVANALNPFATQEWRARDSITLKAVTRLRETVDRFTREWMKGRMEEVMGDSLSRLSGPANQASKLLLDQFHSPGIASGWDLEEKVVTVVSGNKNLHSFVLSDTAANRKRFKSQFGKEMAEGQTLNGPNGKEIVLDDMALDIQKRFNVLTDEQRIEKNSILRAMGLPEIHRTVWYVPPPSVEGKYLAYTFDASGTIIQGGTVIGRTQKELDDGIRKLKDDPTSVANLPGHIIKGRKEIEAYGSLWDKRQMDLINANITAIQGGKINKGSLAGGSMVMNSFDQSLIVLRDNYLNHGTDVLEAMFRDQIIAAEGRRQLAIGETKSKAGFFQDVSYRSIHDFWLQELRGRSPLASTGSPLAAVYNSIENNFNRIMEERSPGASKIWHATTDWITKRNPWGEAVADKEAFDKLSSHLGNHMPFKDVAEMMEARGAGSKAWTLSDVTGNGNKLTASWMLRMLETVHPIMNMAGIINAMPSVVRHMQQLPGESIADMAIRIGHSADIFTTGRGTVGVLSMAKLAKRGFEGMWKGRKEYAQYTDHARKNGMLGQEVAIFNEQFREFEQVSKLREKAGQMTDLISILSDKSEDFSRSWAHHIGIDLALQLGIKDVTTVNNFAHDLANKMIANYSPRNRAELFQGAVGAPIGLFQSFMVNYWQRMFRYIETSDYRSLAIQTAMQAGLFGTKTIPGFQQANALMFQGYDGEGSPYDGMLRRFGEGAGDLLMAGTLSNLPKIFGAEGVDLYSRGDVTPRLPVVGMPESLGGSGWNPPPVINLIAKVKNGVSDAIDLFSDRNPQISTQQIGEILSNMIPNRPMAGMMETLLAGGKDTDSYGQLVSENLTWMESIYRSMGVRSMRQSKELEAFYTNKQAMEIKASQDDILKEKSRAAIRSGNEDALPKIFESYILNGGDERNFRRWYLDTYESATETRGTRQLDDVMRDESKMSMVQRLLDAQVGIQEDEETEDPSDDLDMGDPMDDPNMPLATENDPGWAYGEGLTFDQ